jgi:3-oxoacyl-[acyl-carrier-protein] synthase-3
VRPVGITGTDMYLPERWMPAAELAAASGIPAEVLVERFGVAGKHIAGEDEHVSDLAVAAATRLLDDHQLDAGDVDAIVYFGSTWKDHAVWQVAPHIAHRLGCADAFVLELDYTSCGTPVALRVVRDLLRAEPELTTVLAVAAARESYLLDHANPRARFLTDFGDGAVAALLTGGSDRNQVLGCHAVTDGSFSLDVLVPAGGSREPASAATVAAGRHHLDVPRPQQMRDRLDGVSMPNFVAAARGACERSGVVLADVDLVCVGHLKRSAHADLVAALGLPADRVPYAEDVGHMSGVDPMLALHRAVAAGRVGDGDVVLLLAAGTGYTWAATVVRWGPA